MPNVNRPMGFIPVKTANGSAYNGQHTLYLVRSADATAIGVGDVVELDSTSGLAGVYVNGMDVEGMPAVKRLASGTTGQSIVGVVVGFLPDQTNLGLNYRVASTNRIAMVADAYDTIFEVQEDAVTTPIAAASVGLNASINLGSVNTTTGRGSMQLTSSTVATTQTFPCKILGLVKRQDNAFNTAGAGSDNAKFEVIFNASAFKPNTLGIA